MHAVVHAGQTGSPVNSYAYRFSVGDFVDYRLKPDQSVEWSLGVLVRFLSAYLAEVQIGDGSEWRCIQVDVDEDHIRPALSSVFEDDD